MSRLALAIGDIPFEDDAFPGTEWPSRKPSTPYGVVPVLTVDGVDHAQSNAILRYCGRLAGLYPDCPLKALRVDEILDVVMDIALCVGRSRSDGEQKLRESRKKVVDEDVPRFFGALEKRLELFGDGPWAVGDELTVADLALYSMVAILKSGAVDHVSTEVTDEYTRSMKVYEAVLEHPKVVEWYKKKAEAEK